LAIEQPLLGALPSLRLELGAQTTTRKVDKLSCVRFGSARHSVPCRLIGHTVTITTIQKMIMIIEPVTGEVLAEHQLVAPGESSILDDHYGDPATGPTPPRARAKTQTEKDFLAFGEVAEFLVGAAAAGVSKLPGELNEICSWSLRMAPTRCWRGCSGRWSSDAGGLPTSGPSWPPGAPRPPRGRPARRWS
jgi:hypothetical protein